MFAFLAILFILLVVYCFVSTQEGFDPFNKPPSHQVKIPENKIPTRLSSPPATDTEQNNVEPSNLPGQLPVAPYQQIAAMSPLPYQDTTLIKANRQQLVSMLEMVKGFLAFEAQEISENSDPTIQLPLNTARSDFHTLQSEVQVLNRNPGLQPTITLSHLNEIASNLSYLQEKVRLIGSAGPIQGPIYEFTEPVDSVRSIEGFQNNPNAGQIATPYDLEQFVGKIQGEILRLSASGTNDPVIQARISGLTKMKKDVQEILTQVRSGALMSVEIPIMKNDIDKALPILGKPSEPLPRLIKTLNLPAGLGNMLPSNVRKDPETMREISKLVDKYGDTIVNGISASFAVKYTSPREAEMDRVKNSTVEMTGFPSMVDLENVTNSKFIPVDKGDQITDRMAPTPMDAGRGPSQFDWKERAKQIEAQVKARGLKQEDFGIMTKDRKVSDNFSWKGYVKMICTRLQATMDPALPETCGCPPMDWKGWRIAK
jgi:hypothetical protein